MGAGSECLRTRYSALVRHGTQGLRVSPSNSTKASTPHMRIWACIVALASAMPALCNMAFWHRETRFEMVAESLCVSLADSVGTVTGYYRFKPTFSRSAALEDAPYDPESGAAWRLEFLPFYRTVLLLPLYLPEGTPDSSAAIWAGDMRWQAEYDDNRRYPRATMPKTFVHLERERLSPSLCQAKEELLNFPCPRGTKVVWFCRNGVETGSDPG
jgi:hypothetical protein